MKICASRRVQDTSRSNTPNRQKDHIETKGFVRGGLFFLLTKYLSNYSNKAVAVSEAMSYRLKSAEIAVHHVVENCAPPKVIYSNNVKNNVVSKNLIIYQMAHCVIVKTQLAHIIF